MAEKEREGVEDFEPLENAGIKKDIGDAFLNQPFSSYLADPEPTQQPTGFMKSLKDLVKVKKTSLNEIEPRNKNIEVNSKESDAKIYEFQDMDSISSPSEEEPSNRVKISEADDIPESDELKVFNSESEGEEFIKFKTLSDNEARQLLLEEETAIAPHSVAPSRSTILKNEESKRKGMTRNQLDRHLTGIVENLCIIKNKPVWSRMASAYKASSFSIILQKELGDFVHYISPSPAEHNMRKFVIKRIEEVIHNVWPDAKLEIFGSFNTHLYLPSSDIDLVVFCPSQGGTILHNKLAKALRKSGLVHRNSLDIIPAKVSIVKFTDSIAQFSVDISFNMDGGPRAASIINQQIRDFPGLRAMTLILKQFLVMRGLNEVYSGGLGSYGLTSLITSFLQLHPKIQSGEINPEENTGVLIVEFLELFGKRFVYDQVGIDIQNGGSYFDKSINSFGITTAPSSLRPFSLTINDPVDPQNDITRGTFNLRSITKAFCRAFDILVGAIFELEDRYFDSKEGKFKFPYLNAKKGRRNDDQRRAISLLATIVNVSPEVQAHREMVKTKYEELKPYIEGYLHEKTDASNTHYVSDDSSKALDMVQPMAKRKRSSSSEGGEDRHSKNIFGDPMESHKLSQSWDSLPVQSRADWQPLDSKRQAKRTSRIRNRTRRKNRKRK